MTERRQKYKTKQREIVSSYLAENGNRYLSVDDVWTGISSIGSNVGRTTVYRCLESMAANGTALKAASPKGEARYRIAANASTGQLVCLSCGKALPLDCRMVADFSDHVFENHAFKIDPARTVLYGLCESCMEDRR